MQTRNQRKRKSSSKYRGVSFHKIARKYQSQINFGGKRYGLGIFDNELDAAIAYDFASLMLHQDGIGLNFKGEL